MHILNLLFDVKRQDGHFESYCAANRDPRDVSQSWLTVPGDDATQADSRAAHVEINHSDSEPLALSAVETVAVRFAAVNTPLSMTTEIRPLVLWWRANEHCRLPASPFQVDGYPQSACAAAFDAPKYSGAAWYISMGPILICPPKGTVHRYRFSAGLLLSDQGRIVRTFVRHPEVAISSL